MKTHTASSQLALTGSTGPLSDNIIPATLGKFYVYQSTFTEQHPLYALLDCKANKGRPLAQAHQLGREVHLHFEFGDENQAGIASMKTINVVKQLGHAHDMFDNVYVAPTSVAIEDFYILCAQRDTNRLVEICTLACAGRETCMEVCSNSVVAVVTSAGKYGLILVKELSPTSINIEACHVWLP